MKIKLEKIIQAVNANTCKEELKDQYKRYFLDQDKFYEQG